MGAFPAVETYRAELQATNYHRLDDAVLAEVRRRYAASRHSSAIEGIQPAQQLGDLLLQRGIFPAKGDVLLVERGVFFAQGVEITSQRANQFRQGRGLVHPSLDS